MSGCTPSVSPDKDAPQVETISISPLSRTGGDYKLVAQVSAGVVSDAQLCAGSWIPIELCLKGRDVRDAAQFTQRLGGGADVPQAVAACMALEQACRIPVPVGSRAVRNLMQASSMILANITHFYQQAVPDYVQGLDSAPYVPRYAQSDLRLGPDDSEALAAEALDSLGKTRLCHEMIALLGGRSPQPVRIVSGGIRRMPSREVLLDFLERMRALRTFVERTYLPRVYMLASAYKDKLFSFGQGYKGAICAGALPLSDNRIQQVFKRGVYTGGKDMPMDARHIKTFLRYARFDTTGTGQGFRDGDSQPQPEKADAYSFVKAARYQGLPLETGALARMWVTNPELSPAGRQLSRQHLGLTVRSFRDFGEAVAFSLMGRHIARAEECFYILSFMERWLQEALPEDGALPVTDLPESGEGIGLTEAPQGMLLHYVKIAGGLIERYQVISPEMWNASPKDDLGQRGVIEQALIGTPVPDLQHPVNIGRLVRAFGL